LRRRFDLLAAAATLVVVLGFFIGQFFVLRHTVEARFSRAMHLQIQATPGTLAIANRDATAFRGCIAVIDGTYRSGRHFLLPVLDAPDGAAVRLSLAEFTDGDRLFAYRDRHGARLELECEEYADLPPEYRSPAGVLNAEHPLWTTGPARWTGRF
jgi:hypothetical protein